MPGSVLGNRVRRTEDRELLTGGARYVADLDLPGKLHAFFVRSPIAHARIERIDVATAAAAPGVIGVFTADDLGLAPMHGFVPVHDDFLRAPLAVGKVRFVGDPVAVVVAETSALAEDAAELVEVDYDPLDPVVFAEDALATDPVAVFDQRPDNVALSSIDPADDVLGDAEVVVRGRYVNQRVAAVPIEPNSAAAVVGDDGRLTFHVATQMPHLLRAQLAKGLGLRSKEVHVITPHVGGGFGAKAGVAHEHAVVAALARRLERPVTWTETRSENMLAMPHSRAQIQYVELGLRRDGTITGMRVRLVGDAGAYPTIGTMLPAGTKRMANGPYRLPKLRFDVAVAVTNTTPTGAFRGAGRPEATALLERAVDHAALELGIDPLEIRRANLLAPDEFPFTTLTGHVYDSGDYVATLERAAELAGYDELRAEQAARRERGERRALGIGVASYVEVTAGGGLSEFAGLEIHADGSATMRAGTSAHGQGHQATFAMLVSAQTGIPVEQIRLVQSDTDLVRSGGGTGGSRSLQIGGSAVSAATTQVVAKARSLAAHLLEANVDDIVVDTDAGTLSVAGVPARALSWAELAQEAATAPDGVIDHTDGTVGLAAQLDLEQEGATFPFGTHVAVVEVDLDTGDTTMVRHIAVDDAGTVINPLLFEGQQHGGIYAGAAQALYEQVVYDADGNPLTANLADYAIPSAAEMIDYEASYTETPTSRNPLGAKGIGEAATIGSTPAIQNAVIDALAHLGVRHLDMPCTPERVWAAIRAAEAGEPADPWREPPAVFDRLAAEAGTELDDEQLEAAEGV